VDLKCASSNNSDEVIENLHHTQANLAGWEINKQSLIEKYQAISKNTPTDKMLIIEGSIRPINRKIQYVPDESLS
jgi:hypothetical protein